MKNKIITILVPILLYPISDLVGQVILQDINYGRMLALTSAAILIYQWEIPIFFKMLENFKIKKGKIHRALKIFFNEKMQVNAMGKTLAATMFFNPFWIARHMMFINLGVLSWTSINWIELSNSSLYQGTMSFITTLPIVVIGNYLVQNKVTLEKRFLANSVLSGTLVVAYAIGYKFF